MASIFTRILNQEIDGFIVHEDDDFFAILDIFPKGKGHTLLIPKKEYKDIFEMEEKELEKVYGIAKSLSEKIKKAVKADGIKIVQNNGSSAGQEVMHFHIHIIPYFEDKSKNIEKTDFESIAKSIMSE